MENTCTPNIKSSYTYEDLLASGRGELFGKRRPATSSTNNVDDGSHCKNDRSTAVRLVKGILKRN